MAVRKAAAPAPRKPTHQAPTHSGLSVVSSVLWGEARGVSVPSTGTQGTRAGHPSAHGSMKT